MGTKRINFSLVLNILCVVTSLIYAAFALSYFGKMISLAIKGGEYDWMDFMALLIFVLFPIVAGIVLPLRIVTLVNIIAAKTKIKNGVFAKGNLIATGILQMADVLISFCGIMGVFVWLLFINDDLIRTILGTHYSDYYWPLVSIAAIILGIPHIAKAVAQIVSAIMLFTVKRNAITAE